MKIWEEAKEILIGIGLKVNKDKTRIGHAKEGFDYPGFHFVQGYLKWKRKEATYVVSTQESRKRVWKKIRCYTDKRRYRNGPLEWIVGSEPHCLGLAPIQLTHK